MLACALAGEAGEQPGPGRMLSRLPAAVQKTIRAQTGSGGLVAIDRNTEDAEVSFDVEIVRDGRERGFTVANDGTLLDVEVFLNEVPLAVQKTIQAHVGNNSLGEIDRSIENGETTYSAEMTRDGKTRGFTVGEDGELLDEEVFLAELPAAVQKTIRAQTANGTLGEIDKALDDEEITYDVEFTRDGRSRAFTVNEAGEVVETEVFLTELPVALQQAIQSRLNGGKLGGISRSAADGDVSYVAEITLNGKTRTLTFDPDGTLSSEAEMISLAETPEAVRREIQLRVGRGKLSDLSRVTEGKEISYDVEIKADGKKKSFSLDTSGKLIPDDTK